MRQGRQLAHNVQKKTGMQKPWAWEEVLLQIAKDNKASLQRLSELIRKFEQAARRDSEEHNRE